MSAVKQFSLIVLLSLIVSAPLCASQINNYVFTQLRYNGNWDPYPETWQEIIHFLTASTSIIPESGRRVVTLDDEALFSSPFLIVLGTGQFPELTASQTITLRRYLSNGGLLFVENSLGVKGGAFDTGFRRQIAKVLPEKRLKTLPQTHPLFRSYYLLRKIAGRRLADDHLEGIDISGRAAVIYSQNDMIGAWARDRSGNYVWPCQPGGENQRFEAQKLTLNVIMYSVTGTYKADAIHQKYLRQKMGIR